MKNRKFMFVFGTRPEIIKFAPVINEMKKRHMKFILVSTNQHFSKNMCADFLKEFKLPKLKYLLTCEFEFGKVYDQLQKIMLAEDPSYVFVQGDTDTAFISSIVANDLKYKIIHRESGLRSFDRRMHEEKNRMVIDRLSAVRFVPTENARVNLHNEGMFSTNFIVGNTLADMIELYDPKSRKPIVKGDYIYFTFHRKENLSKAQVLSNALINVDLYAKKKKMEVIYPVHPGVDNVNCEFVKSICPRIKFVDPFGYKDNLNVIAHSKIAITDSGGVQEEAGILGVPCVVLRKTTDRPELVELGASVLIDPEKEKWPEFKFKKKWKENCKRCFC